MELIQPATLTTIAPQLIEVNKELEPKRITRALIGRASTETRKLRFAGASAMQDRIGKPTLLSSRAIAALALRYS